MRQSAWWMLCAHCWHLLTKRIGRVLCTTPLRHLKSSEKFNPGDPAKGNAGRPAAGNPSIIEIIRQNLPLSINEKMVLFARLM